jgi:hypothetical protein
VITPRPAVPIKVFIPQTAPDGGSRLPSSSIELFGEGRQRPLAPDHVDHAGLH